MDVRCPARIRHRPDRQELIPAARIGRRRAIALEILVARLIGTAIPDIMIATVGVALPNLDPCSRNRPSFRVENAPGDPRDVALSRPLVPGNMDQIIVSILRKAQRVKRAGRLSWCRRQYAGGARGQSEQPRCSRKGESTVVSACAGPDLSFAFAASLVRHVVSQVTCRCAKAVRQCRPFRPGREPKASSRDHRKPQHADEAAR